MSLPEPHITRDTLRAELSALELRVLERFATREDVTRLRDEVAQIRREALTAANVKDLISEVMRESETRGWSTRERMMGVVLFLVTIASFLLNLLSVQ